MTEESRRRLTLAATALGSSLAFIDGTVVVVALPTISDDLGLGLAGQQWVYLSYSLALAGLYLVSGAIGDRYGRRGTFVAGVVVFAAASAFCAAAPNEAMLVLARILQGIGGALLTTNSLALLRAVYGPDSGRAIGLWTSLTSLATIAGPPAGGAIVEWMSWRWIFVINVPLAGVTIALALAGRGCREHEQVRSGRMDLLGAALAAAGFAALTYALVEGAERGFGATWWSLAAGAASLVAFVVWQRRASEPLLPLDLFRRRNFAASNLQTFLVYGTLGAVLLYLPIYLQFLGFSAFEAGLALTPTSVVLILLAARFGTLADRRGPRRYLTAGAALIGGGTALLALVGGRSSFWSAGIAALVLLAIGLAMLVAPITSTSISSAPQALAGIASGVNQTVARVGGLLAVAAVGLTLTAVFQQRGGNPDAEPLAAGQRGPELREASIDAFRAGALLSAMLAFAGAAVAAIGISDAEARARAARPRAGGAAPSG